MFLEENVGIVTRKASFSVCRILFDIFSSLCLLLLYLVCNCRIIHSEHGDCNVHTSVRAIIKEVAKPQKSNLQFTVHNYPILALNSK